MIYDIVTYNGEEELFEIRYEILKDFVDEFRVIEFDTTFSGKSKPRLFASNLPKVKSYYVEMSQWYHYLELAKASPNTEYGKGAQHWLTEFAQKESIKDCLTDLQDDDVLFIGDCDEIWNPLLAECFPKKSHKLELLVYSYYLDNRSSEEFYGTLFTTYGLIKDKCLNHVRSQSSYYEKIGKGGWHFTSMGGHQKVKQKLTDSYTSDSYAPPQVLDNLETNIMNNRDFLGRPFTYRIDTSQWPLYLRENQEKYQHLLSPTPSESVQIGVKEGLQ